jgi:folate-binding protein YgfZ
MVNLLRLMKFPSDRSIFHYRPAAVLRADGPDAESFLQGQFTNDLSKIAPGGSAYGLWLDRKGKVIADSNVTRALNDAGFWITSISSSAPTIEAHLGAHIIADDVVLTDETTGWRGISFIGPGVGGRLNAEPRAGVVFPGRRDSQENWEWIFPETESASATAAVAGARVLGAAEIDGMRIAAGIPAVPADIGPSDLPNEGGLDKEAISYSKGCYLGQEVMARVKSLGRVRRTLVRVRGAGALPILPAGLWSGEKKEGEIRSAAPEAGGFSGLALVSVNAASKGDALALALGASPTVELIGGR